MLSKPYFTGIAGSIKSTEGATVESLRLRAGANTGNFLFVKALRNLLGKEEMVYQAQSDALIEDKYDYIAISAANWVNEQSELGELGKIIEKTDLPCLVVGLGAQVQFGGKAPSLTKGTERFLKLISERSKSISVRGEHTQEVLSSYGINNTHVTGCPSIIGAMPDYCPTKIKQIPKTINLEQIVLQGTRHGYHDHIFEKTNIKDINLSIYRFAHDNNAKLLLQSEIPDMYHVMNRLSNQEINQKNKIFLEKLYSRNINSISTFLKDNGMIFWDVDPWLEALSKYDVLIGTRIHGVISGLLAGIPSILLAHDERTLELAKIMNLPYVDLRDFKRFDMDALEEIVFNADMTTFVKGYSKYKHNFTEFFLANNIRAQKM